MLRGADQNERFVGSGKRFEINILATLPWAHAGVAWHGQQWCRVWTAFGRRAA